MEVEKRKKRKHSELDESSITNGLSELENTVSPKKLKKKKMLLNTSVKETDATPVKIKKNKHKDINSIPTDDTIGNESISNVCTEASPNKHKKKKKKRKTSGDEITGADKSNDNLTMEVDDYKSCNSPESVDSGCVPDKTHEKELDSVDWKKIKIDLYKTNNFISNIISLLPTTITNKTIDSESANNDDDNDNSDDDRHSEEDKDSDEEDRKKPAKKNKELKSNDYSDIKARWTQKLESLQRKGKSKKTGLSRKEQQKENVIKKNLRKKLAKIDKKEKKIQFRKDKVKMNQERRGDVIGSNKVYNQHGSLVFSKFDFGKPVLTRNEEEGSTKKPDLQKHLKNILENKKKVQYLEKSGKLDDATKLKEDTAWNNALAKASGEKVKDNVELIKKSIKVKESKKKQSMKKWEERNKSVDKKKQSKQDKRQANIKKRKKDVLSTKMKKMKSRGHIVPGF